MSEQTGTVRRRVVRWLRWGVIIGAAVVVLAGLPFAWIRAEAAGNLYDESDYARGQAPRADIVIVLGSEIAPGGTYPKSILRGRLDTAAQLVLDGHARVILVSGDGGGRSGDEPGS